MVMIQPSAPGSPPLSKPDQRSRGSIGIHDPDLPATEPQSKRISLLEKGSPLLGGYKVPRIPREFDMPTNCMAEFHYI